MEISIGAPQKAKNKTYHKSLLYHSWEYIYMKGCKSEYTHVYTSIIHNIGNYGIS
jgi:hypothetical protein